MPITAQQQQESQAIQHTAAHDGAQQVRLVGRAAQVWFLTNLGAPSSRQYYRR
jgi:hypothetical protein